MRETRQTLSRNAIDAHSTLTLALSETLEHNCVMTTLYRADDPNLLTSVLNGEGVHLEPGAVLDGLTTDQAYAKPHGLPPAGTITW